jgi:hypothetical protein
LAVTFGYETEAAKSMTPPLTRILAALGALPFIACALLPLAGIRELPLLGETANISVIYGLTIASFMAGAHWGTALAIGRPLPINLFLTSNVVAVAAWFSVLLVNTGVTLFVLSILFAYLLLIDYRLYRLEVIERAYWHTRGWITAVVIACLALVAVTHA